MYPFANKRLILVALILIWIEASLLPYFAIRNIKPDLIFILIAFYAFQVDWKRLVPLAFLLGVIRDLMTNAFFGVETASLVGGAFLLQFFADQFDRDERWLQLSGLFTFSCFTLLLYAIFSFVTKPYPIREQVFLNIFFTSVYTTVLGAVLIPFFVKVLKQHLFVKQYELF